MQISFVESTIDNKLQKTGKSAHFSLLYVCAIST